MRCHAIRPVLLAAVFLIPLAVSPVWAQTESPETATLETAASEDAPDLTEAADDEPLLFDETPDAASPDGLPYEAPRMGSVILRMALGLVVVTALLVIGLVAYQRLSRRGMGIGGAARPLRIVDKVALGPKKWVCLLNAGGRYLLLGVAEKDVNLLTELFPPEESDEGADFASLMRQGEPAGALSAKAEG